VSLAEGAHPQKKHRAIMDTTQQIHSKENVKYLIVVSSRASVLLRPYVQPLKASISFSYLRCTAINGPFDLILSTSFCSQN
jgi:hypothetical protein